MERPYRISWQEPKLIMGIVNAVILYNLCSISKNSMNIVGFLLPAFDLSDKHILSQG